MKLTRQQKRELIKKMNDKKHMAGQIKKMEFAAKEREHLDRRQKNTRIAATVSIVILVIAIAALLIFA